MAFTNPSPNMNLGIPQVGLDPGPQYATDVNNCLTIVDGHNHAPGYGVAISPNGMNINSDLSFHNNNLTNARSLRLQSQGGVLSQPGDIGCLYENGVNLYYNDGNGVQIPITAGGALAGTPGSISGLTPPASASYNSGTQTFIFQSAANTPANVDGGSFIFRDVSLNSFGVTVNAPPSLGANYSLTLPLLPSSKSFVTLDNAGLFAATFQAPALPAQNSYLALNSTGVITTQAPVLLNVVQSGSSGAFSTTSPSFFAVPGLSVSITTTTGGPVMIMLVSDSTGNLSFLQDVGGTNMDVNISNGVFNVYTTTLTAGNKIPISISTIDLSVYGAAGTYTYTCYIRTTGGGNAFCEFAKLIAYEII